MSVASIGLECGWRIGLWVYWGLGTVYPVYFLNVYTIKAKANKNTWKMGMALRNLKKEKQIWNQRHLQRRDVLTPAQLLRWIHFSGWKRNMVFNLHTCLEVHCGLVECIVPTKWMTFGFCWTFNGFNRAGARSADLCFVFLNYASIRHLFPMTQPNFHCRPAEGQRRSTC